MKICVYSIAKNEAQHVKRWVESAQGADLLLVADTGSIDDTINLLKGQNVSVHSVNINPFRFDKARQAALDLIPEDIDICVSLDLDEVLTPNWREHLENAWNQQLNTNRLYYRYIWAFDEHGNPKNEFMCEKIHGRHSHIWTHPVHEVLRAVGPEVFGNCEETLIEHHADNTKSRKQYLSLLEMSVTEQPDNDRNSHYLGREYFFHGRYYDAITELERHLKLPKAVWNAERCSSMRYIAKCYLAIKQNEEAHAWLLRAVAEDYTSREAVIDLANYLLEIREYVGAWYYALKAMPMQNPPIYINEAYAQKEGAYDIAALACYHLKDNIKALFYGQMAIEQNPTNQRLKENYKFYHQAVNE